jgi:hypothetical protein
LIVSLLYRFVAARQTPNFPHEREVIMMFCSCDNQIDAIPALSGEADCEGCVPPFLLVAATMSAEKMSLFEVPLVPALNSSPWKEQTKIG